MWSAKRSQSPIIGTAIHDGRHVRPGLRSLSALSEAERLREEDPFTAFLIGDLPNQIVFHRSRFEIDLNRRRDEAVYLRAEQAWGLKLWKDDLPQSEHVQSLMIHDDYYAMLRCFLEGIERSHGEFVLLDVHSYNHRRADPDTLTDPDLAPDVNIGTFSMDRGRWAHVVDPLMDHFRSFKAGSRPLDVRENIAFQGKGEQTRFVHEHFPKTGCAIAIEFKKIFMDEWTGQPHKAVLRELREAISAAVPLLERSLRRHP
ncbi:N-formylglutamate amidohydrolase (plasmid) [Rhizobium sp. T1470]|uniref:N-formylglutamate amidohydrolase n=1 Tax=Rhizobium favelukesii TaxID=348824 RepID=UPI001CD4FC18|nr:MULTISPECIES: N-formylglutamate amidohydrolase [Rhizobium]MCA0805462.1 N-formylglutamate amidohydrolase [Rhizobium sp. T1473]MCS0461736.1 N-formylglutamate amidohydrolase [Rhizobium favelukesii]UFS80597.1 N-formylglutamate amidohydrolase [Rhizobium sp. T136]